MIDPELTPVELARVGREAALLLNDAIRQLGVPQHLFDLFTQLETQGRATELYAAAARHTAVLAAVVGLYRLDEVREGLLVPWLYTTAELRAQGFMPIGEFVGDWGSFEIVRSQYAAHALARPAVSGRQPGRLVPAAVLGRALRRTGLWDAQSFLRRVGEELVPPVQQVRDALLTRFPDARAFVEGGYAGDVQAVADVRG